MARGKRVKKWFMLQVWRIQQVAQILTLVLLGITDSLLLWKSVAWRGGIIENPYAGPLIIMIIIAVSVWAFAIFWDLRLKMWRDQMNVIVERNPYSKERLSSKEVFLYTLIYLPLMEHLGKDDPKVKEIAEVLRKWFKKETADDQQLVKDVKEIFDHIGSDKFELMDSLMKEQ